MENSASSSSSSSPPRECDTTLNLYLGLDVCVPQTDPAHERTCISALFPDLHVTMGQMSLSGMVNQKKMKEHGVSGISLAKALESLESTPKASMLLYSGRQINTEYTNYPNAIESVRCGVKRVPRYWMFLINGHLVDEDDTMINFYSNISAMTANEAENCKFNIQNGKTLMITGWDEGMNSWHILSSVTFVVGHNSILCLHMGTLASARRCGFNHLILTSILEYANKVFKWELPLLLFQDNDAELNSNYHLARIGFQRTEYTTVKDVEKDVPYDLGSSILENYIMRDDEGEDVFYHVYEMELKLVESISRTAYLEKYDLRSELDSLPMPAEGITCCAGVLCSSPHKQLFNHCACIYCQKNCHEECSFQRVNDDLVIPVNLQDSKRPMDLYTVCKACEKEKLNGIQCANYHLNPDGSTSHDPRKTCTRSRVGIYPSHKCYRCKKFVHPKCSTYVPKTIINCSTNSFTTVLENSVFSKNPMNMEPICDPCRFGMEVGLVGTPCCLQKECKVSAYPVSPWSRCFGCKKCIHFDCVTSTRRNPRTKWKLSSAAGGHEWPGSTLQFCPQCHIVSNAYTQNENEFIKPYETCFEKLILFGYKKGNGVWENPENLQVIEFGQEQIVYSLGEKVYWDLCIMSLFFSLIAFKLPSNMGMFHNMHDCESIENETFSISHDAFNKPFILHWVFFLHEKNSSSGHWSLIIYERNFKNGKSGPLKSIGRAQIFDSVEIPNQKFYTQLIGAVVKRFFDVGKKKMSYTKKPVITRVKATPKKKKPRLKPKFLATKWVIFEEPTAILLPDDGPNCGPITCLEALKYCDYSLNNEQNRVEDFNAMEPNHQRKYVFHIMGQLITEFVKASPSFITFKMPWMYDSTNSSEREMTKLMKDRMKLVSDDFEMGWGKRDCKSWCCEEDSACVICSVDLWKVHKPRVHDTCYFTELKCGCRNRYHLKCIIEYFENLDKFHKYEDLPPLSALESTSEEAASLGVDMKCLHCGTIQDSGKHPSLHVHSVSGVLRESLLVPINICPTNKSAQCRHDVLYERTQWTEMILKPLLKEETERLKTFNATTECYFGEENDESVVNEGVTDIAGLGDKNISETNDNGDDPNTSKVTKSLLPPLMEEENTPPAPTAPTTLQEPTIVDTTTETAPFTSPPMVENPNTEGTTTAIVPITPPAPTTVTANTPSTSEKNIPQAPTDTVENTNTHRKATAPAPAPTTLQGHKVVDTLGKTAPSPSPPTVENPNTEGTTTATTTLAYNTKLRERKDLPHKPSKHRRKRRRRGGRILTNKDLEDEGSVWDVFDKVPFNYNSSEDRNNQLKNYRSKEDTTLHVDELFWTTARKANMLKLKEDRNNLNLEQGRGQNRNHMAKLQLARVLDRDIMEEEDHFNRELCAQSYDQITRLKVVYYKHRKKPVRIGYLSDNETEESEENWWGRFLDGRTVELYTSWIVDCFHADVVAHIRKNPKRFICVPPGAPELSGLRVNEENKLGDKWAPPPTRPLIWAQQIKSDWKCLFYSLASVLYHLDDEVGATYIKNKGDTLPFSDIHPGTIHNLLEQNLKYGTVQRKSNCDLQIVKARMEDNFFVAQLCAKDGGVEHAISILDDWIFDSNCKSVVPLTCTSLNICCSGTFEKFKLLYIVPKKFNRRKRNRYTTQNKLSKK